MNEEKRVQRKETGQSKMMVFENDRFGTVRTIDNGGEPWFVAADVCKALGLPQVSRAMSKLDDDEGGLLKVLCDFGNRSFEEKPPFGYAYIVERQIHIKWRSSKMKSKFFSFLSGALVMLMVFVLPVSALAASNSFKIEGSPINVLVNGEVFQPKDVNGNDVLVFVYNGTTYAPLRALAEAYGLEVGYDGSKNLATVTDPDAKSDFASAWTIAEKPVTNYGTEKIFTAKYSGGLGMSDFKAWWKSFSADEIQSQAEALAAEAQSIS